MATQLHKFQIHYTKRKESDSEDNLLYGSFFFFFLMIFLQSQNHRDWNNSGCWEVEGGVNYQEVQEILGVMEGMCS